MTRSRSTGGRIRAASAILPVFLIGLQITLSTTAAEAATTRTANEVIVGAGEVIDDDLYALGWTIEIKGRVNGDVLAFGNRVIVSGTVSGDLVGGGGNTIITGEVQGSVRRCGNGLVVTGKIGDDVMAAVMDASLARSAHVGRDVLTGRSGREAGGPNRPPSRCRRPGARHRRSRRG